MENLWKRDAAHAKYGDLFASVRDFFVDMSIELLKTKISRKDNQRSTEWRLEGNGFFRQENWHEAMQCYNKSLCFAEICSENVALAYSNRSACLFHMQMFNEVLIDIELALNANLPDHLKPKLEQRKNDSLKLMPLAKHLPKLESKLSYEADKNFPCMANAIEIKCNREFGRHLIAKCDIPVGRVLLVEKDIPRIMDGIYCYTCLRVYTNCVTCSNCPEVTFCSIDCMNRNQIHKFECGSFFPHLRHGARFQIKVLLMAIASFSNVDGLMQFVEDALLEDSEKLPMSLNDPKSKYHFFFKLEKSTAYDSALTEAYEIYKTAISLPKISDMFNSDRKQHFLMHLTMHHLLISRNNVFGDHNTRTYVPSVSALLNHSCTPNIMLGRCAFSNEIVRATGRPIRKGEPLFIKYPGFDGMPSNIRKAKLKLIWGFDCHCDICEPIRVPLDRKQIRSDPSYKFVLKNRGNRNEFANIKEKCIEFLNKYGHSAWSPEIEFVFDVYKHYLL